MTHFNPRVWYIWSAFAAYLIGNIAQSTQFDCIGSIQQNDTLVFYDLCDLQLTNDSLLEHYRVIDEDRTYFHYFFNIGGTIDEQVPNETCNNDTLRIQAGYPLGYCNNIQDDACDEDDIITINQTGLFLQMLSPYTVYTSKIRFDKCRHFHFISHTIFSHNI